MSAPKRQKVVQLDAVRLAPVPSVVAALQELLERAERGELRGFAMAGAADQNCDFNCYDIGDGNIAVLVLGVERVKARLLSHVE